MAGVNMFEFEYEFDELKIYRGEDIRITPKITVTQPTIGQIAEFGEKRYFSAVHTLTAVGADLKWQLNDYMGIDYTQIEDYDLFIQFISQVVSSRKNVYKELTENSDKYKDELASISKEDLQEMLINPLELILKDIDMCDFIPCTDKTNNQVVLYNVERDITIDRVVYTRMVDAVRKIHGLKRNNEIPANERTRLDLIDDARDEAMAAARNPYRSILKPLVSALTVKCGLCGDDRIWNMPVNMFFDNIKRANKIQDSQLLLQGAYSGFASLKEVDKNRLDWTGEI